METFSRRGGGWLCVLSSYVQFTSLTVFGLVVSSTRPNSIERANCCRVNGGYGLPRTTEYQCCDHADRAQHTTVRDRVGTADVRASESIVNGKIVVARCGAHVLTPLARRH